MPFNVQFLDQFPEEPGVYFMKSQENEILYIGKAKNLRSRLKQYFAPTRDQRVQIPYLLEQVAIIETLVSLSEKDALILENTLIKKHKPKYNILLKDDKTFIHLVMTEHEWPRLKLVRYKGKPTEKGNYFGPYTSAFAARQTLDLIGKIFPLRQCSDHELANRTRPCLLYGVKRCMAPCKHFCTKQEYQEHVHAAERLLKGEDLEVLQQLKKEMTQAADDLEFEKAQDLLRLISHIEHVTQIQHVDCKDAKGCDAIGLYREATALVIAILFFREGKVTGAQHFSFHDILAEDEEILSSFLLQHYKEETHPPKEIVLPHQLSDVSALEDILQTTLLFPKRGRRQDLIDMATKNAKAIFTREQDARSLRDKQLMDLTDLLQLTRYPRRIECFDTSNIAGTDPVASVISFVNGEYTPAETRLYKIQSGGDDYTAMREVLLRHLKRAKEKNHFCDLLIVDGGKGQLQIAKEILKDLDIATIDLIALTKEDTRHDKGLTQEKIYVTGNKEPIVIPFKSPLLFLLQKIRDEAHRTAIQYHRKRRAKRVLTSALDHIPGIGPIKKKRLLKHFGSVAKIQAASKEELKKVPGITQKDIEALIRGL